MKIKKIDDPAFCRYGRIVQGIDFSDLVEAIRRETPLPDGVAYEPSIAALEATKAAKELQRQTYGELPIEVGYCNGHNYKLNAIEYHRSSEINVAATDAILIVGMQQDITDDFKYDTSRMEAFLAGGNGGRTLCHDAALCALQRGRRGISSRHCAAGRNELSAAGEARRLGGRPSCRTEQMADRTCRGRSGRRRAHRAGRKESGRQRVNVNNAGRAGYKKIRRI